MYTCLAAASLEPCIYMGESGQQQERNEKRETQRENQDARRSHVGVETCFGEKEGQVTSKYGKI